MADEDAEPLDAFDPRFAGDSSEGDAAAEVAPRRGVAPRRRLVATKGPGPSLEDPRVRSFHRLVRVVGFLGVVAVGAVFVRGLDPASGVAILGDEAAVRAAVADRPLRVCYRDEGPCAWLTVVEGRLLALSTSGPLPAEYGRQGVGWCPSSGWFGANGTGSRYDHAGRVVRGPAFRSLDRFGVVVDARGRIVVDFADLSAGVRSEQVHDALPPDGPDCASVPFDRDPDLRLDAR